VYSYFKKYKGDSDMKNTKRVLALAFTLLLLAGCQSKSPSTDAGDGAIAITPTAFNPNGGSSATSNFNPTGKTSAKENAKKYFANTNLTVYNTTATAVKCGLKQTGKTKAFCFYDAKGTTLGQFTKGKVDAASSGYTKGYQGALNAFNDYRGVARPAAPGTAASGSTSSGSIKFGADSTTGSATTTTDANPTTVEVVAKVNEKRVEAGVHEFQMTDALMEAAQLRAKELATSYSHTRPNGESGVAMAMSLGTDCFYGAENIAYGQKTPSAVVTAWMNSTGHRKNILNAKGNTIGAGCHTTSDGKIYWVLLFAD